MTQCCDSIKVISWDVDGTLYSAADFKRQLYINWLRCCWRPSVWSDIQLIAKSQRMMQAIRLVGGECSRYNSSLRMQAEERERPWFARALQVIGLRPGVREALDALRARGYRQIIVSDYHADYKLEALGVSEYFERIFACEDDGIFKPSANVFKKACDALTISPTSLLHIGDREDTDGVAARDAGCCVEIVPAKGSLSLGLLARSCD